MAMKARMVLTWFIGVILVAVRQHYLTFDLCLLTFDLRQLSLDPVELTRDVFDDVARLEVRRKHIPGIGFDLEVRGERRLLMDGERLLEREAGRSERAEVVEK